MNMFIIVLYVLQRSVSAPCHEHVYHCPVCLTAPSLCSIAWTCLSLSCMSYSPQSLLHGMNKFLESLEITFRRDPNNFRPRINKLNSVKVRHLSNLEATNLAKVGHSPHIMSNKLSRYIYILMINKLDCVKIGCSPSLRILKLYSASVCRSLSLRINKLHFVDIGYSPNWAQGACFKMGNNLYTGSWFYTDLRHVECWKNFPKNEASMYILF